MVSLLERLLQIIILLMPVHLIMLLRKHETDASPLTTIIRQFFYDNVHVIKNIRNNLFNAKKFVFPEISLNLRDEVVSTPAGFISWKDLRGMYDEESKLPANLRKANKLNYRVTHPGNNKQCVNLALAVFDETTIVAIRYGRFLSSDIEMVDNC